jgi:hypothetical protein
MSTTETNYMELVLTNVCRGNTRKKNLHMNITTNIVTNNSQLLTGSVLVKLQSMFCLQISG